MTKASYGTRLLLALTVLLCLLAAHPVAPAAINDDWSSAQTVRVFADTGHVVYNGWLATMIGLQIPFGALFVKLFGYSFTTLRASTMLLGCLSAPLLFAIFRRCGIGPRNAVLGTLTYALSPVHLPVTSLFMTDVPAVFVFLLFLYAALRALQADTDRSAVLWLAAAATAGFGAGTIRQIYFLAILVALPSVAFALRKRARVLLAGGALWIIGAVATAASIHWFKHQQYAVLEPTRAFGFNASSLRVFVFPHLWVCSVSFLVFLLPVIAGVAARYPLRGVRSHRLPLLSVIAVAAAVSLGITWRLGGNWWGNQLVGDAVKADSPSWHWELLGIPTANFTATQQAAFACIVLIITAVCVCTAVYFARATRRPWSEADTQIFLLIVPFAAAYLVMMFTRATSYDRYLLPLMVCALIMGLRWCETHLPEGLSPLAYLVLAVMALWGTAVTHDMFALARARQQVVDQIVASGVPRTEIYSGFAQDGYTQVGLTGYVNEPRIYPRSAFRDPGKTLPPPPCRYWFAGYLLSFHGQYQVAAQPDACFPTATAFPPVTYTSWLGQSHRTLYANSIPPQYW